MQKVTEIAKVTQIGGKNLCMYMWAYIWCKPQISTDIMKYTMFTTSGGKSPMSEK